MKKIILLSSGIIFFTVITLAREKKDSVPVSQLNSNEKEISLSIKGCTIYGTLLAKNNNQRLAIIIAGSGPTDRNGNNPFGVSTNAYKMLADELVKKNIASFRFDKRGIGKSINMNMKEADLTFADYIKDVNAIFDYLHDTLGFKKIYLIGHSEGSLIAMISSKQKPVKGYISLSGAGRPIDVVIDEQLKAQPEFVKQKTDSIFASLKNGKIVDSVPQYLYILFRPSVQPYIISWLKFSPAEEIKELHCPILILQGACDIQVKTEDAQKLHEANSGSKLDIIPLMTHTLKNAGENCNDADRKTYTDSSLPLNSQLITDIITFIEVNNE